MFVIIKNTITVAKVTWNPCHIGTTPSYHIGTTQSPPYGHWDSFPLADLLLSTRISQSSIKLFAARSSPLLCSIIVWPLVLPSTELCGHVQGETLIRPQCLSLFLPLDFLLLLFSRFFCLHPPSCWPFTPEMDPLHTPPPPPLVLKLPPTSSFGCGYTSPPLPLELSPSPYLVRIAGPPSMPYRLWTRDLSPRRGALFFSPPTGQPFVFLHKTFSHCVPGIFGDPGFRDVGFLAYPAHATGDLMILGQD